MMTAKTTVPQPEFSLRHHRSAITSLSFAESTQKLPELLTGDASGYLSLTDLRSFRPTRFWRAHCENLISEDEKREKKKVRKAEQKAGKQERDSDGGQDIGMGLKGEGGIIHAEDISRTRSKRKILSQGRDHKVRVWRILDSSQLTSIRSKPNPSTPIPSLKNLSTPEEVKLEWEIPTNATGFCKCSYFPLFSQREEDGEDVENIDDQGLVATVSLVRDELIDLYHYPSKLRVSRSIGVAPPSSSSNPMERTGTLMSLKLFWNPNNAGESCLHLLAGYEDGRVSLYINESLQPSSFFISSHRDPKSSNDYEAWRKLIKMKEGEGWGLVWTENGHREPLFDLVLEPDLQTAWSAAADHNIIRYRLNSIKSPSKGNDPQAKLEEASHMTGFKTHYPGKNGIAVAPFRFFPPHRNGPSEGDQVLGTLIGTAGWDGEARLYTYYPDTSDEAGMQDSGFLPFAVLSHHREQLSAIAIYSSEFSSTANKNSHGKVENQHVLNLGDEDSSEEEDSDGDEEVSGRRNRWGNRGITGKLKLKAQTWVAVGGRDELVSLWRI